jgi:hypothetical protein
MIEIVLVALFLFNVWQYHELKRKVQTLDELVEDLEEYIVEDYHED